MKEIILKILNFFNGLVKKNFGWKIFSCLMAIFLWFVVMNIINPTEEKVYSVYITLNNEAKLAENNLVILNREELEKTRVDIRVKATRSDLDLLDKKDNREKIKAVVDLNQFAIKYPENIDEAVYVGIVPNLMQTKSTYQIVGYNPQYTGVNLDKYITLSKNVTVLTKGNVAEGYLATNPIATPESIEISGASTVLKKVESVCVEFDYALAEDDISAELVPVAYDVDGKKIEGISFNTSSVKVSSVVSHKGVVNIEPPKLKGEPLEGYMVSDIAYNPQIIDVVGDDTRLKNIKMNDFDVSGISSAKTFKYDISGYLNSYGLKPKNPSDSTINVTVSVEKIAEKDIEIKSDKVILNGKNAEKYEYVVSSEVPIKIKGLEEEIDTVKSDDISVVCDVTGLEKGVHSVVAEIKLPQDKNLKMDSVVTFDITITEKNLVENDESSESESIAEESETQMQEP